MGKTRILHLEDRVFKKPNGHFRGSPGNALKGTVDTIYLDGSFCIRWDNGKVTHEKRYGLYAFPTKIKS